MNSLPLSSWLCALNGPGQNLRHQCPVISCCSSHEVSTELVLQCWIQFTRTTTSFNCECAVLYRVHFSHSEHINYDVFIYNCESFCQIRNLFNRRAQYPAPLILIALLRDRLQINNVNVVSVSRWVSLLPRTGCIVSFVIIKRKPTEVLSPPAKHWGLTRCSAWRRGWDFPIFSVIG